MIRKSSFSAAPSATEVFKIYRQTCAKKRSQDMSGIHTYWQKVRQMNVQNSFLGWKMGIYVQIFAKWEAFNLRLSLALEMSILERDKSTSYHFLFVTQERKRMVLQKPCRKKTPPQIEG